MANEVFTATQVERWHAGGMTFGLYDVTGSAAYPNTEGGEPFSSVSSDFREVLAVIVTDATGTYTVAYDSTNDTLVYYVEDGGSGVTAEVANDTDIHTVALRLLVIGR